MSFAQLTKISHLRKVIKAESRLFISHDHIEKKFVHIPSGSKLANLIEEIVKSLTKREAFVLVKQVIDKNQQRSQSCLDK